MKKSYLLEFAAIVVAAFFGLCFVACNSDDDDDEGYTLSEMTEKEVEKTLVGTWSVTDNFVEDGHKGTEKETWTFEANGSGYEIDSDSDDRYSFSYSVWESDGSFYFSKGHTTYTIISLSSNTFKMSYVRDKWTSGTVVGKRKTK